MAREEDGGTGRRSSVQFSLGLIRQLAGRRKDSSSKKEPSARKEPEEQASSASREPEESHVVPPGPLIPPMSPFVFPGAIPGTGRSSYEHHSRQEQRAKELAEMREALESSRSLADKLLLQEIEEVEKVKSLAKELHDKEFRAPSWPVPCQSEKDECIQCYKTNSQDVLRCASVVSDYVSCSRRAQQDLVRTTPA